MQSSLCLISQQDNKDKQWSKQDNQLFVKLYILQSFLPLALASISLVCFYHFGSWISLFLPHNGISRSTIQDLKVKVIYSEKTFLVNWHP
jgi:hypothetical protein